MRFDSSPTELTTAATDAAVAVVSVAILVMLWRLRRRDRWKASLWAWVFGLLAAASALGTAVHGLELGEPVRSALWHPLYLSLGLAVALFAVGSVYDWRGEPSARRLVPWALGVGVVFYGLTQLLDAGFVVFVIYEAVAIVSALAVYLVLAAGRRLAGAGTMAAGIGLTLVAAAIQTSDVTVRLVVPLDHNGVFHLVQMVALVVLASGLRKGTGSASEEAQSSKTLQ